MSAFARFLLFLCLHARACKNKYGRDITSDNKRIHRSFDHLVPDRTKTTKDDQIRTFPRWEKRLCFILRKNVISWPETTESERERKWANWTRNPYQLNSNFLVRLYVRSCAKERVVSILFIIFWIGRGRNQFASSVVVRVGKGWWCVSFRYANRLPLPLEVSTKTNTHEPLGKKKKKLFLYSHLNIYPRKTRFLSFARHGTCSRCAARCRWKSFYSFIFLCALLLWKRVWKVMERERERIKSVEFFLLEL